MKATEIEPKDIWNESKQGQLSDFISEQSKKQSKERLLRNKLLSIQYQLEDYANNADPQPELRILDFVKMYLEALNISKRSLSQYFEMHDGNLHKYLSGERKLNAEIAMKLSSFSHTKPEQWFAIQVKNELSELRKDKNAVEKYKKYGYENLVNV
jgi:antitoxin HigA-1